MRVDRNSWVEGGESGDRQEWGGRGERWDTQEEEWGRIGRVGIDRSGGG